jgi:hypothetical protein
VFWHCRIINFKLSIMKKFLPIASIVFLFAACTSSTKSPVTSTEQLPIIDTTGFAQFQNWKAQNELVDAPQADYTAQTAAPAVSPKARASAPVRKRSSGAGSGKGQSTIDNSPGSVISSEGTSTAKAPARKKVSKAAKGAVIGGVGGAAAGAVVNKKNRVVGAVIGAVVGAGGGYVIGRGMDKKDGRYLIPTGMSN